MTHADAPWTRMAMLGDSTVAGTGDPSPGHARIGWVDRIADALPRLRARRNLAVRDLLIAEIAATQLRPALAFEPDVAVVNGGINDMFRRRFELAAVRAQYEAMIEALQRAGATVITFTMLDWIDVVELPEPVIARARARFDVFQEMVRDVARERGTVLLELETVPIDRSMFSADRMHLHMRGQAYLAEHAVARLDEQLRLRAGARGARRPIEPMT